VGLTRLPAGAAGSLYREPPFGSVIWLRRDETPVQRRLALFHQMGHLALHPEVLFCAMRAVADLPTEQEADAFASAILMPRRWLRRDAPKVGLDVSALAQRYAVPPVAMARRLRELRLIAAPMPGS
jgi:Zn-dependent peptidase ImmA (M78 family)